MPTTTLTRKLHCAWRPVSLQRLPAKEVPLLSHAAKHGKRSGRRLVKNNTHPSRWFPTLWQWPRPKPKGSRPAFARNPSHPSRKAGDGESRGPDGTFTNFHSSKNCALRSYLEISGGRCARTQSVACS